jgi:hypothetical protein
MEHIGWFVWWAYEIGDKPHRAFEFFGNHVVGYSDLDDIELKCEEYVKYLVDKMRKDGHKYGLKIKEAGYKKAYVENW